MSRYQAFQDETHAREAALIVEAFEACDWYLTRAAAYLGISLSTLQYMLANRHPEIDATRPRHRSGNPNWRAA